MSDEQLTRLAPIFMAAWVLLGIASWILIATRSSAQDKRWWHRRFCIFAGVLFGAFLALLPFPHPQKLIIIPVAWLFLALIMFLNIRFTFFCDSCGKMSVIQMWFSKQYFCPRCGQKLK